MIREEKSNKESVVKRKFCDECDAEMSMFYSSAKCQMCKRDICNKCIGHEKDTMTDFREIYCHDCWEIGGEYRDKVLWLEENIENVMDEWKKQCDYNNHKKECEDKAAEFANEHLFLINNLVSDDYKVGFREGVEKYIIFNGIEGSKRKLLIDFARFIQEHKNKGLDYDCVELEVDVYLKKVNKENNK